MDFVARIFDTSDFPPRWQCGNWSSEHGWLHVLSDLGVWSAYVAIPCVLIYFLMRRRDLPFQSIFLLFGAFILACGTTHLMEAAIFWWPAYRLAGLIKLFTAAVSWATVVALVPVVPKALAMRSPEELEREIEARKKAELALHRANDDLEGRIEERTVELVRANATLRDERERFRTTLASIGDGVIATDTAGRVTFLNPVAEKLTGWQQGEAEGRPLVEIFRIVHETTRAPVENPTRLALEEGRIVGLANHTVLIARDGTEWPLDDSAAPIRSGSSVSGAVLVFREITERKRQQEALREQHDLVRSITDNASTAIFMTDSAGRCTFMNPAAEAMTGYGFQEADGRGLHDLIHHHYPDGRPFPVEECSLHRAPPEPAQLGGREDVFIRKSGSTFPVVCHAQPILKQGKPVATVIEARDISDELEAERRIYNLLAELRQADRLKDDFLALLAHELRNPLAPIRNALEVLRLANGNPESFEGVRALMERQVSQLVRLVDDLLDLSRITRNKLELRREHIQLRDVVESSVETSRPAIDAGNHALHIHVPSEPLPLYADLTRLAQIFSNLLNNSAKYTPPGGQIWLSAVRQDHAVVVTVKDTGIGISETMLAKVFDMFTQADQSLERSQGGLGIGLTLVKRLVELHGGAVAAQSEGLGKGSAFVVRLPLDLKSSVPDASAPDSEHSQAGRYRILVVDDNKDSTTSLSMMLSLMGHETRSAYNGVEAIEAAQVYLPEVILLDIGLPKLNGFDVCRKIRAHPWGRDVLIIALTGWGQEEDKRRAKEAGFDHHFTKPLNLAELEKLLRRK